MIDIPRRGGLSRATFSAHVTESFHQLYAYYQSLDTLANEPEWAGHHQADHVFYVELPLSVARAGGDMHAINSLVNALIKRQLPRVKQGAHVERDGKWLFWVETD